ncbi:type I toxin-antitoxin system Ibs family toxin [Escherichia coli]|nr:type I toxin-antitoxin system Ibs family toxin [Escherichia coli]EFE2152646.1 type I toxin-antitoxin system Ibs family toxin [Escherichia coli O8:H28]EET6834750.1 type I toxin-antitoxin system Ibs family toxin [Escherichia coli]EET7202355.1 type I toxin-antitoxin system Ibs family toxin [Escherichia coli]EEV0338905.1 type I toxin-antitoxin system Ibs family toxin [Escherichia coli]
MMRLVIILIVLLLISFGAYLQSVSGEESSSLTLTH